MLKCLILENRFKRKHECSIYKHKENFWSSVSIYVLGHAMTSIITSQMSGLKYQSNKHCHHPMMKPIYTNLNQNFKLLKHHNNGTSFQPPLIFHPSA